MQVWTLIAAEELSVSANPLSPLGTWFTNSFVFTVIVTGLIIWVSRWATRNMQLVPSGPQNLFEFVVETLYNTFEGVVGRHMITKVFPLLATLFIFILAANWIGLFPGVGTIGFGKPGPGFLSLSEVDTPLLRPASADLNMTLGMALLFMGLWAVWTIQEVGVIGFLKEQFVPKGDISGFLRYALIPLFLFVGVIELISIAIRGWDTLRR
jgi:F-type H+-transporting ATPase subunit a